MMIDGPVSSESNTKTYMTTKTWGEFYSFPESAD